MLLWAAAAAEAEAAAAAAAAAVLANYSVRTLLDAGCGDANWQHRIPGIAAVRYHGVRVPPSTCRACTCSAYTCRHVCRAYTYTASRAGARTCRWTLWGL
jgi:hypothetical protein